MIKKISNSKHLKFAVLSTDIICFTIIDNKLHTLLGKVKSNSYYPNHWAEIGGLIKSTETAEEAADRLLIDKAGLINVYKEQLYTFSSINRDPRNRVVSVAYLGIVKDTLPHHLKKTDIETKWCPVETVPKLAYDHNEMIKMALERLRSRINYTNIAQYFLPDAFTLSDLQKVYETVLGEGLDKRNFRKKILLSSMLRDTKRTRKQGVMRPAVLYSFVSKDLEGVNLF